MFSVAAVRLHWQCWVVTDWPMKEAWANRSLSLATRRLATLELASSEVFYASLCFFSVLKFWRLWSLECALGRTGSKQSYWTVAISGTAQWSFLLLWMLCSPGWLQTVAILLFWLLRHSTVLKAMWGRRFLRALSLVEKSWWQELRAGHCICSQEEEWILGFHWLSSFHLVQDLRPWRCTTHI